ncbi:hypothetical protein DPMN_027243 [Dreissena polymorpha]|uniref:Uncharacterized protein n=1 Tax=Dreissena polymorpha TaxID=45954 RepID=A0A9D4RF25_DREPO|nr:hypothetical protein DPMN_027243 [Dreissena polymorpha]
MSLVECECYLPSKREITGSIPTVGAFSRFSPKKYCFYTGNGRESVSIRFQ